MTPLEISTLVENVQLNLKEHQICTNYLKNGDLVITITSGTCIIDKIIVKNSRIYERTARIRRRS